MATSREPCISKYPRLTEMSATSSRNPDSHTHSSPVGMNESDHAFLAPLFLGPSGENGDLLEQLLTSFLRDHVYWRRNFHPEDPPSIPLATRDSRAFRESTVRLEQALFRLTADLKRSTPAFAPRYIGHMMSDPLLPALLGQLVTTLYNPNNIASEAAPVTLQLEIDVGRQLATMIGMNCGRNDGPSAWGHITSGGTVANYEALWLIRAARLIPPALAAAAAGLPGTPAIETSLPGRPLLEDLDSWALANFTVEQALDLQQSVADAVSRLAPQDRQRFATRLAEERFDYLGHEFFARHRMRPPVILVPATAHYSWSKAMTLLGLGRRQLRRIPTDAHMRMDTAALDAELADLQEKRVPVLAVVGVLGTTEFGTIDPVHEILALRQRYVARGMGFAVHVDAAWGGYLATIFRKPDGSFMSRKDARKQFRYFPSTPVYQAFRGLANADTVTIDPHKLGYVTYGAGALVARDHRLTELVGEHPPYIYDEEQQPDKSQAGVARLRQLGDYILEGSKPGATAAAVWLTHEVVPLNNEHFGRLVRQSVRASETLYDRLREMSRELQSLCQLSIPIEPDTNLICLALRPAGSTSLRDCNELTRRVFRHLSVDSSLPVQTRQFIGSHTSMRRSSLCAASAARLAGDIGVDPATFVTQVSDPQVEADHIFLIRHTLMNPWLDLVQDGKSFLDIYCEYLRMLIARECT